MGKGSSRPRVVVISGSVGSGKTSLAERLAELLGGCAVLIFDHYERYVEWPQDIGQWIRSGADPRRVKVPRLKEDLLGLLEGESITDPLDNRVIHSSEYILVEEPSGREREEIAEHIDLVVYVDVPQDMCVVRVIQRAVGLTWSDFEEVVEGESREDLAKRVKAVVVWLAQYERMRPAYIEVSGKVKGTADIVVNGMKSVDEIARQVLDEMESLKERA